MKLKVHKNRTNDAAATDRPSKSRLIFILVASSLVLLSYSANHFYTKTFMQSMEGDKQTTSKSEPPAESRLGDGCYHVFLDVGANRGVHGRFLLEPEKYPATRFSVGFFERQYGANRDNQDYCVFEFEANDNHWPRLREISSAYAKMGWRYHLVEAAVSDVEGNTTFFHQGTKDAKSEEWGFSGAKNMDEAGGYEVQVATVRLSEWIQYHIHERKVPKVPPSTINSTNITTNDKPPVLGMKMDIEGYEYVVLPDLIHSNAFCNFGFVFGEFHSRFAPMTQFRANESFFHRIPLDTPQQANKYAGSLIEIMQASRNCGVQWHSADDESYLHDGQPLPTA